MGNVNVNRLKWVRHAARMESTWVPLILLDNDPEGQRGRGRPKLRWIECILADLRTNPKLAIESSEPERLELDS